MKAQRVVNLSFTWGSKDMIVSHYLKGQPVWVPRSWGRDRNEWGVLDRRDYRLEITGWLYSDGALCPDVTIQSHAGTHAEVAGYHMINAPEKLKEKAVGDYPPETWFGEAAVIDLTPFSKEKGIEWSKPDYTHYLPSLYRAKKEPGKGALRGPARSVTPLSTEDMARIDDKIREGDIVLFFNNIGGIMIGEEGGKWLAKKGVKLVGIQNVWLGEAHDVLLCADIPLIEGLRNLDKLTKERVYYISMPWPLINVGASPVWAVAIEKFDYTPM